MDKCVPLRWIIILVILSSSVITFHPSCAVSCDQTVKAPHGSTRHSVIYTNLDNTYTFYQWLFGFVDDNSMMLKLENSGYNDVAGPMTEAVKHCLEVWQRLVHLTGGELELTKSSHALIACKLKGGKEQLCNMRNASGTISLRSEKYQGMQVELKINEARAAER